ncbi:Uncharacterised protein [Mycobacteroides abscessus subsp. abscessus]|nr:Uncharacterised protein [Mycobacteroides abscessus subsp. abscessus]SIH39142.1 Uncharacterised protein [Mycobacteroides abscessus subsp. abscessus]SKM64723.1 Uncharacterised protein [Mycobacteroides abscessus subsp. abscessus]SKN11219.1 Uncharacterised protein [Mycobacteroides abscessus subsp. abscessus]SKP57290.1 Uncharacterised protein [Mycobacteroides abscessus subsp. abscessus]
MVCPICWNPRAASASVMLLPEPPRSHTTTTPRSGVPGPAASASRAARASGISFSCRPPGAKAGTRSIASRKVLTVCGLQCAGIDAESTGGAVKFAEETASAIRTRMASVSAHSAR